MSKTLKKIEQNSVWKSLGRNCVLRIDDDHYISYNPNTGSSHFGAMLDSLIDDNGEETALVDSTDPEHTFRILHGNWCDDYEQLVPKGFEACVDFFYLKSEKCGSGWSTHEMDRATRASQETQGEEQ